jgi:hypothetical protein
MLLSFRQFILESVTIDPLLEEIFAGIIEYLPDSVNHSLNPDGTMSFIAKRYTTPSEKDDKLLMSTTEKEVKLQLILKEDDSTAISSKDTAELRDYGWSDDDLSILTQLGMIEPDYHAIQGFRLASQLTTRFEDSDIPPQIEIGDINHYINYHVSDIIDFGLVDSMSDFSASVAEWLDEELYEA